MNNNSPAKSFAKQLVSYYSLLTYIHESCLPRFHYKKKSSREERALESINYTLNNSDALSELLQVAHTTQPEREAVSESLASEVARMFKKSAKAGAIKTHLIPFIACAYHALH